MSNLNGIVSFNWDDFVALYNDVNKSEGNVYSGEEEKNVKCDKKLFA